MVRLVIAIGSHIYFGDSMKILPVFSRLLAFLLVSMLSSPSADSQSAVTSDPHFNGPYNALFLPDGDGLRKPLLKDDSVL